MRKLWRFLHKKIVVRYGSTRTVFLVGRLALKVPAVVEFRLFLYGLLGNIQEKQLSGMDEKLCPVYFSFPLGLFNVMPRCEALDGLFDWECLDWDNLPVEKKADSFGLLDGEIVAVDYGGGACG